MTCPFEPCRQERKPIPRTLRISASLASKTNPSAGLRPRIFHPSPPWEINPEYSLEGLMLKLKLQYFGHLMWRADSLEKPLLLGKIEGRMRRGMTEDEMVGWYHWLNGHKFEKILGDSEGQKSLVCCCLWGRKELDMTQWLSINITELLWLYT